MSAHRPQPHMGRFHDSGMGVSVMDYHSSRTRVTHTMDASSIPELEASLDEQVGFDVCIVSEAMQRV